MRAVENYFARPGQQASTRPGALDARSPDETRNGLRTTWTSVHEKRGIPGVRTPRRGRRKCGAHHITARRTGSDRPRRPSAGYGPPRGPARRSAARAHRSGVRHRDRRRHRIFPDPLRTGHGPVSEVHTGVLPWRDARGPTPVPGARPSRPVAAGGPARPTTGSQHHVTTPSDSPRLDRDATRVPRDEPGPDAGTPAGRTTGAGAREGARGPARLSLTQVIASALAAVSTTVLLSYFGTAGTIIGAGIASALTVVANYVYTRSIQKTREQLVPVVGKVVQATAGTGTTRTRTTTAVASVPAGRSSRTGRRTPSRRRWPPPSGRADRRRGGPGGRGGRPAGGPNRWLRLVDRYGRGRVLTVTALALFVAVMGVVLVVELVIGKPLADAVRGVEGSGTTISRERTPSTEDPATPAPSAPRRTRRPSRRRARARRRRPRRPTSRPRPRSCPGADDGSTPEPTTPETPAPTPSPGPGEGAGGTGGSGGAGGTESRRRPGRVTGAPGPRRRRRRPAPGTSGARVGLADPGSRTAAARERAPQSRPGVRGSAVCGAYRRIASMRSAQSPPARPASSTTTDASSRRRTFLSFETCLRRANASSALTPWVAMRMPLACSIGPRPSAAAVMSRRARSCARPATVVVMSTK